ncbi:MAG: sodium pump decarboxylase subunit gamma [Methylococcaceae bacterium]|nr:sodium pump decarboxylase subunit gamma [Methylococcaceae bacterium]
MAELITSGVELMLVGMGIVYAFLVMLIVAIHGMAALVARFFPERPVVTGRIASQVVDQKSIAAISAAVHQYRIKYK